MKVKLAILISAACCFMAACTKEQAVVEPQAYEVPEGMRAVQFTLPGVIGAPLKETSRAESRMGNMPDSELDSLTLKDKDPVNLPDGTTLWIKAQEIVEGQTPHEVVNSYVVRNISGTDEGQQMLYPCTVDSAGNVVEESSVPMFLKVNTRYRFHAVSPARAFVEGSNFGLYVNNKEYVIATDIRYDQTRPKEVQITEGEGTVQIVEMNYLINQTAQLEFTIYAADNNPNIYSLDVMPQGVEISGVQNRYSSKESADGEPWNWLMEDTLEVRVGQYDERVVIRKTNDADDNFIRKNDDGSLYVKCPILPTDVFSTPIIVLFNLEVNGIPTQYELMLREKIFRSGYTYHYKGKLDIQNGVTVMTWQYVSWDIGDLPLIPRSWYYQINNE